MQVERMKAEHLTILHTAALKEVWEMLVTQLHPILFVVDENGGFFGALTKGDLAKGANGGKGDNTIGLDPYSAGAICNRNPRKMLVEDDDADISKYFDSRITCIPLLDNDGKLVALAQPQKKNQRVNLNIGSGGTCFDGFVNLDVASEHYSEHHESAKFVEFNILTDKLPYDDNSVSNIYLSHVVEHLSDDAVMTLLSECKRALRTGGVMRLACPDADFLAEISSFNNDFWYWRRDWFRQHKPELPCHEISQFDFLVREVATEKVGKVRLHNFKANPLSPENRLTTLKELVTGLRFNKEQIGNHINFWTFEKLTHFAHVAGFRNVIRSKYQGCISLDMKGQGFDVTRPEMSLYVDLIG